MYIFGFHSENIHVCLTKRLIRDMLSGDAYRLGAFIFRLSAVYRFRNRIFCLVLSGCFVIGADSELVPKEICKIPIPG